MKALWPCQNPIMFLWYSTFHSIRPFRKQAFYESHLHHFTNFVEVKSNIHVPICIEEPGVFWEPHLNHLPILFIGPSHSFRIMWKEKFTCVWRSFVRPSVLQENLQRHSQYLVSCTCTDFAFKIFLRSTLIPCFSLYRFCCWISALESCPQLIDLSRGTQLVQCFSNKLYISGQFHTLLLSQGLVWERLPSHGNLYCRTGCNLFHLSKSFDLSLSSAQTLQKYMERSASTRAAWLLKRTQKIYPLTLFHHNS